MRTTVFTGDCGRRGRPGACGGKGRFFARAARDLGAMILLAAMLLFPAADLQSAEVRPVYDVITVNSAITPPVSEYILRNIEASARGGSDGIILQLDTPGGLDSAMRDIAKGILNAPLPVIVYVAPSGARAASAGVIITVSAHIAAMAPGTNIGAAHPVGIGIGQMDKVMAKKVENDAVAYARGIAVKRLRNADWVERAVRKSESVTAEEALRLKVIDFVSPDIRSLLRSMDGRTVELPSGKRTLATRDAVLQYREMGLRQRILTSISDPNIAYILLLVGLAGLYFEFANPGAVLPGVIGGLSLILAFFALQTLPVNFAGVLLILFAVVLFIAEIKVTSHGLLAVGGVVSLTIGSLMLFDTPEPTMRISLHVLIPAVAVTSLFFIVVVGLVIKAQRRRKRTGSEEMIGMKGTAVTDIAAEGKVSVQGEYWNAFSDVPIPKTSAIRVTAVDKLRLKVEKL
ncbi:MAG TPA: nodulation protein NfeD [Syntrophales bacterium]|mgnify:CR=1 FL=1|nr:nodulation protein NfeD [Syntrophales bacterium]